MPFSVSIYKWNSCGKPKCRFECLYNDTKCLFFNVLLIKILPLAWHGVPVDKASHFYFAFSYQKRGKMNNFAIIIIQLQHTDTDAFTYPLRILFLKSIHKNIEKQEQKAHTHIKKINNENLQHVVSATIKND